MILDSQALGVYSHLIPDNITLILRAYTKGSFRLRQHGTLHVVYVLFSPCRAKKNIQ